MNFGKRGLLLERFVDHAGPPQVCERGRDERHSQFRRHEADDGLHLDRLLFDPRTEAGRLTAADNVVVQPRRIGPGKQDERFVLEFFQGQLAGLLRQRMFLRQCRYKGLAQDRHRFERGLGDRRQQESDVEAAGDQVADLGIGRGLAKGQVHQRELAPELAQYHRQHVVVGNADEPHCQFADFAAARAAGNQNRLFDPCQDLAGLLQQGMASLGQRDMALGPVEQHHAQLALQRANLHRQRRLGNMQLLRCAAEMEFFGEGDKIAQVAQFHLIASEY